MMEIKKSAKNLMYMKKAIDSCNTIDQLKNCKNWIFMNPSITIEDELHLLNYIKIKMKMGE